VDSVAVTNRLPETARNERLRRLDWRFLLPFAAAPGDADLAIPRRPSGKELRRAYAALRPGGEVRCEWRLPLPGTAQRARRHLESAGFVDVRLHWAWPLARRGGAQFWIPVEELGAASHLFQLRPANRRQAIARRLWSLAAAGGALAPLSAIGRKPGGEPEPAEEIEAALDAIPGLERRPRGRSWLLLTGGRRSINKVVGIPFAKDAGVPGLVVKFARVAEAEGGLEREAAVLRQLEATRPALPGVPRVLATGRRVGRLAIAETALHGPTLLSHLNVETFPRLAMRVTDWLVELAGLPPTEPRESWQARLVEDPLDQFKRDFAAVGGDDVAAQARGLLATLPDLPPACEHRDCSPWNVVLSGSGEPALLDWESAEPLGLPGLDLVYFLANAAFVLEGALESGRTLEAYRRLLDPAMFTGRVFARCAWRYCDRLGLDPETLVPLRALGWIVHSRSDHLHLAMDARGAPDAEALGNGIYLSLLREDLRRHREGI
jgi:aminoglycoside phosphotransferase (APT) family kinase protein